MQCRPHIKGLAFRERFTKVRRSNALLSASILLASTSLLQGQYARPKITNGVDIEQKLNSPVPLDLVFHDETGQTVPLRTYFGDKPVILQLVYFKCTSLCPMSLHETVSGLAPNCARTGTRLQRRGGELRPIRIQPAAAAKGKDEYRKGVRSRGIRCRLAFPDRRSGCHCQAHFGRRLAISLGRGNQTVCPRGRHMVATPDGKMSRYFYGIQLCAGRFAHGAGGRLPAQDRFTGRLRLLFCFHYDALQGKYTLTILNVLKAAGVLTLVLLAGLLYILMRNDKKKTAGRIGRRCGMAASLTLMLADLQLFPPTGLGASRTHRRSVLVR